MSNTQELADVIDILYKDEIDRTEKEKLAVERYQYKEELKQKSVEYQALQSKKNIYFNIMAKRLADMAKITDPAEQQDFLQNSLADHTKLLDDIAKMEEMFNNECALKFVSHAHPVYPYELLKKLSGDEQAKYLKKLHDSKTFIPPVDHVVAGTGAGGPMAGGRRKPKSKSKSKSKAKK